jgi:predicted metal-dependent hydrolase
MPDIIQLGDLAVQVFRKDIRNIHLSVYPPEGRVVISCPSRHSLEKIRAYALAKLAWIRKQQRRFQAQQRETQRKYMERESHYIWGKRYLMCVATTDTAARVEQSPKKITLHVQPGATQEKREELYEDWMRFKLKSAITPLIAKWEPILGVNVKGFFVQRMKTKWGSCSPTRGTIRLNTELAKKPDLGSKTREGLCKRKTRKWKRDKAGMRGVMTASLRKTPWRSLRAAGKSKKLPGIWASRIGR